MMSDIRETRGRGALTTAASACTSLIPKMEQTDGKAEQELPLDSGRSPMCCHCLRVYDCGAYDLGSFYVLSAGDLLEEAPVEPKAGVADQSVVSSPTSFGYSFVEGLEVVHGSEAEKIKGNASECAIMTMGMLQRQVMMLSRRRDHSPSICAEVR